MNAKRRKHILFVAVRGTLLVLLAVIFQGFGYLTRLESLLHKLRVGYCQGTQPAPDPSLAHLDVDEDALKYIGRWPWPRSTLARIYDEIALTRPKLLVMDVIFSEREKVLYGPNDPVGVDGDRLLADAVRHLGCCLVPVSVKLEAPPNASRLRQLALPLLIGNPELAQDQCLALIRGHGITAADFDRDPDDSFAQLRQSAFDERIWRELADRGGVPPDPDPIRRSMLPHTDPLLTGSTLLGRLFDAEYDVIARQWAMLRFTLPVPPGAPPLITGRSELAPILPMAHAAAVSGFVDYLPESVEGTVRVVPLMVRYRGRMVPQMGLAAACAVLGVDPQAIRLAPDTLTLPRPGKLDIVLPVSVRESTVIGPVGALMEVPLYGRPGDWLTMYDVPRHLRPARHTSVTEVWDACQTRERLDNDEAAVSQLLVNSYIALKDDDSVAALRASPPTGEAKRQKVAETLQNLAEFVKNLGGDPGALDADTRKLLDNVRGAAANLRTAVDQTAKLEQQLARQRAALRESLGDHAIFFGSIATSLNDQQPTSLFGSCPGVVIHGAIYNAILTNNTWRNTSPVLSVEITAAAALLALLLVTTLSPGKAFAASLALAVGYLLFDGYVLFARHNLIVAAAGPAVAIPLVYSVMTVAYFLTEISERARITRRFRSYLDPALVDYMVANPDHVRFNGERRELTLGFSDLAGFTTLSDQIGERIVPLLADYASRMFPLIRTHGCWGQQSGDGLYFFFGAPRPDPDHACHAVECALAMHAALIDFNRTLDIPGGKPLSIRVGLATGMVVVGDVGPPDASSYAAMGPTTNLAARLESANKFFGTRTLVNARTAELVGDAFLLRPIANLRVIGKLDCTVVHEPLCLRAQATDHDLRLAAATSAMFEAFRVGDFDGCRAAALALAADFGEHKLSDLYLDRCAEGHPDRENHCEGQIVLTEK